MYKRGNIYINNKQNIKHTIKSYIHKYGKHIHVYDNHYTSYDGYDHKSYPTKTISIQIGYKNTCIPRSSKSY